MLKLAIAQHHAQLLAMFVMDNPLIEFTHANKMKLHAISKKLNKSFVTDLKWQHQWIINSFFKST